MKEVFTIPSELKAGFQERHDTYTKNLGFVIYKDPKSKWRSEKTWTQWKDDKIPVKEFKNEPKSGFVLNKDVGGAQNSYGWNARREKVRVYDPRGFEVEITVDNLLFLLQECSSIKGKGLEGEFVYAWPKAGTGSLVLLPTSCAEYTESISRDVLHTKKVDKKDVIPGHTYLTKDNDTWLYLGRLDWWVWSYTYRRGDVECAYNKRKVHLFRVLSTEGVVYAQEKGFTKLAKKISTSPSPEFANMLTEFSNSHHSSPAKALTIVTAPINPSEMYLYNTDYAAWDVKGEDKVLRFFRGSLDRGSKDPLKFVAYSEFVLGDNGTVLIKPTGYQTRNSWGYGCQQHYLTYDIDPKDLGTINIECENGALCPI